MTADADTPDTDPAALGAAAGEAQAYSDPPNTHRYRDADFVTNWTPVDLFDVEGTRHVFHVPTAIVEKLDAVATAAALAAPPAASSEDALEAAFTKAVNAPSASGRGIAVPHYRDVERIWAAIRAAAGDGGLDVERLRKAVGQLHRWDVSQGWAVLNAIIADIDAALAHTESATDGSGADV